MGQCCVEVISDSQVSLPNSFVIIILLIYDKTLCRHFIIYISFGSNVGSNECEPLSCIVIALSLDCVLSLRVFPSSMDSHLSYHWTHARFSLFNLYFVENVNFRKENKFALQSHVCQRHWIRFNLFSELLYLCKSCHSLLVLNCDTEFVFAKRDNHFWQNSKYK